MFSVPNIETKFTTDIRGLLMNIVTDTKMVKMNHVTPYGYKVNISSFILKSKRFTFKSKFQNIHLRIGESQALGVVSGKRDKGERECVRSVSSRDHYRQWILILYD